MDEEIANRIQTKYGIGSESDMWMTLHEEFSWLAFASTNPRDRDELHVYVFNFSNSPRFAERT